MVFNLLTFTVIFIIVTSFYFVWFHKFRTLLLAESCYFYMCFAAVYISIFGFRKLCGICKRELPAAFSYSVSEIKHLQEYYPDCKIIRNIILLLDYRGYFLLLASLLLTGILIGFNLFVLTS